MVKQVQAKKFLHRESIMQVCNMTVSLGHQLCSYSGKLAGKFLFGSVKGAYTGAVDKPGLWRTPMEGPYFLMNSTPCPYYSKGKLLRVFQEKQACRIGSNRPYPVNCRLISATNQDPRELIHDGILRTDLYFRLAVLTLEIPPLAKRDKDVLELTRFFINRYNSEYNLQIHSIDDDVEQLFLNYQWPEMLGNWIMRSNMQ